MLYAPVIPALRHSLSSEWLAPSCLALSLRLAAPLPTVVVDHSLRLVPHPSDPNHHHLGFLAPHFRDALEHRARVPGGHRECTTTSRFCPLWTGPSLNCLPQDSSVQGSAPPHVSSLPSTTPGFGMTESVFSTEWQHSALATESTKLVPTMTAEGMKPNVPEPSIARFSSSSESRLYLRVDER